MQGNKPAIGHRANVRNGLHIRYLTRLDEILWLTLQHFLFQRFLHNLSVPHTVTTVDLTPDRPSKKQLGKTSKITPKPNLFIFYSGLTLVSRIASLYSRWSLVLLNGGNRFDWDKQEPLHLTGCTITSFQAYIYEL